MNIETLLSELQGKGVTFIIEGENVRYRAPKGTLSPELLDTLRERKKEVLAHLTPWPGPCPMCRQQAWWLSIYGVIVCGVCHPPGPESPVRAWFADEAHC